MSSNNNSRSLEVCWLTGESMSSTKSSRSLEVCWLIGESTSSYLSSLTPQSANKLLLTDAAIIFGYRLSSSDVKPVVQWWCYQESFLGLFLKSPPRLLEQALQKLSQIQNRERQKYTRQVLKMSSKVEEGLGSVGGRVGKKKPERWRNLKQHGCTLLVAVS